MEQMKRVEEKEEGKDNMAGKNGEEMPERDEQEIMQEVTLTPQRYLSATNKVFSFNCHVHFSCY